MAMCLLCLLAALRVHPVAPAGGAGTRPLLQRRLSWSVAKNKEQGCVSARRRATGGTCTNIC